MKKNRLSIRQAFQLQRRAEKIFHREMPGLLLAIWMKNLFTAGGPYVTVYFSARVIDELSGTRDPKQLMIWALLALFSGAAVAFLNAVWMHRENRFAYPHWYVLQKILTGKMLELDFEKADEQNKRDQLSQIRQNMNMSGWGIRRAINHAQQFSAGSFGSLGALALSITLFIKRVPQSSEWQVLNHPAAALGILLMLILISCFSFCCSNKVNVMWTKRIGDGRAGNRIFAYYNFIALSGNKRAADIRLYNQQELFWNYGSKGGGGFAALKKICHGKGGLFSAVSQMLTALFAGMVYLFVGLKAIAGAFGAGEAAQYIGALTGLSAGLGMLIRAFGGIVTNAPFMQQVFSWLDTPNEMHQGSLTTEKRSDNQYDIEFRNVSFRYPNTETWALRNCSLKFRVGQKLAVVGPNGSGKTTFIKLLCRLYDPTEGEILLNGIDIRKYDYQDYLNLFSVVFQDFQLLAFPLGQNVAARENYDPERARKALEQAGFAERLKEMPKGLDTCLYREFDREGVMISGGEAQKIALARALYKDAPFVVLDEPTAALDPVAEAEIYANFNAMVGDRTAVYISHRLSSCKFCDEILVFDGGRTVQHGTHSELVKDKQGKYWELWSAQAKYYQ